MICSRGAWASPIAYRSGKYLFGTPITNLKSEVMDSQEKSLELENEKNAEVTPTQAAADNAEAQEKVETTEAAADTTATPAEEKAEHKKIYKSKAEVVGIR